MRVLVACEFSGIVREAFTARGHDAWSCDLLPSEIPSPKHLQLDAREIDLSAWDLLIAFPPCTYLCLAGARWWPRLQNGEQEKAIHFFLRFFAADCPRIAIENPVGILSTRVRRPSQIIHPWQFGHGETKATCLWLFGLPALQPTEIVSGRTGRVHRASPGGGRWRERSRTLPGIADAMAAQWGGEMDDGADAHG